MLLMIFCLGYLPSEPDGKEQARRIAMEVISEDPKDWDPTRESLGAYHRRKAKRQCILFLFRRYHHEFLSD
jgi:hypothetical protein